MEPERILHIVHTLNRGGMESRIMDLYRHLDRERFQYDFYVESGNAGMFDQEVVDLGGRVFLSQKGSKHNIPNFRSFNKFIKKHPEYRIVNAYNQWAGWYLKEAKKCGIPHRIANSRTSVETKSLKNTIKNLAKLNVNKYATHRFAVSKKAGNWLFGEKAVQTGLVKVWPNAIDTEKFKYSEHVRREIREELGLGDAFTVIHVGNIRFEKNHPFLLKVFSEIKKRNHTAKLILVGNGNIRSLSSLIDKLGIRDSIQYLGVRKDIPRLLQAGDVFVFPSFYEGFPGAALEAEAAGLKCLISDTITDEVLVTDHIKMASLSDKPERWAEKALSMEDVDREYSWKLVRRAGYDIGNLAMYTQEFYEGLMR